MTRARQTIHLAGLLVLLTCSFWSSGCIGHSHSFVSFTCNLSSGYSDCRQVSAEVVCDRSYIRQTRWFSSHVNSFCESMGNYRVRVQREGQGYRELRPWWIPLDEHVEFCFSPDSSKFLMMRKGKLVLVDVDSVEEWTIHRSGELLGDVQWIDDRTISFSRYNQRDRKNGLYGRELVKVSVDDLNSRTVERKDYAPLSEEFDAD
ncbi:MAG: hypothetical protein HN909_01595 [Phycisphaerales bacterium]|jgi:hypothetical protein|nr:hypothetical protein [Phycisphaerales bacterium]MBT7170442.1 hypothetical protein [Phycisphaerales bacterium]